LVQDTFVLDTEKVMVAIAIPRVTDWLSAPETLILGTVYTVTVFVLAGPVQPFGDTAATEAVVLAV
jgi:hypothetical protein